VNKKYNTSMLTLGLRRLVCKDSVKSVVLYASSAGCILWVYLGNQNAQADLGFISKRGYDTGRVNEKFVILVSFAGFIAVVYALSYRILDLDALSFATSMV
jgi:hypothetical protein